MKLDGARNLLCVLGRHSEDTLNAKTICIYKHGERSSVAVAIADIANITDVIAWASHRCVLAGG